MRMRAPVRRVGVASNTGAPEDVMLEGPARKVSLVLVFLSACGWVVFVTGFGIRNSEEGSVAKSVFTSHWLLAVCGLVFYFIYFLHLLWGNKISSVAVLGVAPLFLGVVGAVLQFDSRDTSCNSSFPALLHQGDFEIHILIEFVGAVIAGVFMWLSLVLWPLLRYSGRNEEYTAINN